MTKDTNTNYKIFIQARMSSVRFPGKMLTNFNGEPMLGYLINRFEVAGISSHCVILTSEDQSDDKIVDFLLKHHPSIAISRGPLNDVLDRFRIAAIDFPTKWIVRICGDSPLIDPELPIRMLGFAKKGIRFITNISGRTFPPGQSVECIENSLLNEIAERKLDAFAREHVTTALYSPEWKAETLIIRSSIGGVPAMTVDLPDDLPRVETLSSSPFGRIGFFASAIELA